MKKSFKILIISSSVLAILGIAFVSLSIYRYFNNPILDEFVRINDSISTKSVNVLNPDVNLSEPCKQFLSKKDSTSLVNYYELTKVSDSIYKEIETLKQFLITKTETAQKGKYYNVSTDYLIKEGNAKKLKSRLQNYVDKDNKIRIQLSIPKTPGIYLGPAKEEDGTITEWEMFYFDNIPLAGIIVNLSMLQSESRNVMLDLKSDLEKLSAK